MIFSVLIFPLLSFLWCAFLGRRYTPSVNAWGAVGGMVLSAFFAGVMLENILGGRVSDVYEGAVWLSVSGTACRWSFAATPLVGAMTVLVTFVSTCVHIYAAVYMRKDVRLSLFMGYLSFFTVMMVLLVTSGNLLNMFVGWEGVGLASYLLIGFWYERPRAANAAQKAFIMNRIGDMGFVIAMVLIFATFQTLDFKEISGILVAPVPEPSFLKAHECYIGGVSIFDAIVLGLILAASGKSAQFFLHTWLPDAMEGPTPVSALLHSATMVTAGVYLLLRMENILLQSSLSGVFLPALGIITAFYGGCVAITAHDIKRIIAYSTCSQLGLMLMLIGLGSPVASFYHLLTHAFFKSLLFLVAGSVIQSLSGEQDIRNMGGLWKCIPLSFTLMLVGVLALIGIPPLSGAFSKMLMLNAVAHYDYMHQTYYSYAFIGASGITAVYGVRLIVRVFFGSLRVKDAVAQRIKEPSKAMCIPMIVLAGLAIGLGGFLYPGMLNDHMRLFARPPVFVENFDATSLCFWGKIAPLVAGVGTALFFLMGSFFQGLLYVLVKPVHTYFSRDGYVGELHGYVVRGYRSLGRTFYHLYDEGMTHRRFLDRIICYVTQLSLFVRRIHNGDVRRYIFVLLLVLLCAVVMGQIYYRKEVL
ncbi:MAG: NADH-quinone oxidoreductase subunit L [Alphaproteobacteria bacterium]|nr:MAG: NADH-quinone oxidoreductase subunit L [Alphaproteobacteria bacterium]